MFHPHWRDLALEHLDDFFDLIIVGGGVSGCGILLDAAQRGLHAVLLEKDDIASGTSSRSSKLIHGGLRYLKQMQFRITRMACRERDRMLALNPHLVRPIRFLYPAKKDDPIPGWTVDLGLWMYDRLTERPEKHAHLAEDDVRALAPCLAVERLERALAYTDAVADDAALTLAIAATGFAFGGLVLTRAEVLEATTNNTGRIDGVVFRDHETGATHTIRGHLVINATGVWVDELRGKFGIEGQHVRPSRGSHIIVGRDRIPIEGAVTVPAPDDGRPVFLIPHPEGVLVGTTDIYHTGSLDDPRATTAEVHYLVRAVQQHFPECGVSETDVVGAFAGLRPILDIHADNPSEASREEGIWEERGMLTVSGGKLTTWRVTAEEAVDEALRHLRDAREAHASPCYTAGTPLVGVAPPDLSVRLQREGSLLQLVASAMARRLGSWAWEALGLARGKHELDPLLPGTDLCAAEVRGHLRFSAVLRVDDLVLRRTRVGMWRPELVEQLIPLLRSQFQEELGWSAKRWDRDVERCEPALAGWSPRGIR